jgi:predicted nucleic acid-binding protein
LTKAKLKIKTIGFSVDDKRLIQSAKQIAAEFDVDDYPFLALALKLDVPIWTNDKEIIKYGLKTGKYLALDTEALENLLREKSIELIKDDLEKKYAGV